MSKPIRKLTYPQPHHQLGGAIRQNIDIKVQTEKTDLKISLYADDDFSSGTHKP